MTDAEFNAWLESDTALRVRGHVLVEKFDEHGNFIGSAEGHNLFLTAGINELWKLVTGQSANTFTNAQAQIGVGDSAAAAAAGQTDLQAATNKTYKAMDATFPSVPAAGAVQFRATFGSADANYVWAEFVVKHGTSLISLDRGVSAMGTKAVGTTWQITVTLSITANSAWYAGDDIYVWDSITDTDTAVLNAVLGADLPKTSGVGAIASGGYWGLNSSTYDATPALVSSVDLSAKSLVIAVAIDSGGVANNFVQGLRVGVLPMISVWRQAGNFGWYIHNGTVDGSVLSSVAFDTVKRVAWLHWNAATGKLHWGHNQVDDNPGGSAGDAPPVTMPASLTQYLSLGAQNFNYGSFRIVNKAGLTLADAKAIAQSVQTKMGL
jgi:hypothetical protein